MDIFKQIKNTRETPLSQVILSRLLSPPSLSLGAFPYLFLAVYSQLSQNYTFIWDFAKCYSSLSPEAKKAQVCNYKVVSSYFLNGFHVLRSILTLRLGILFERMSEDPQNKFMRSYASYIYRHCRNQDAANAKLSRSWHKCPRTI